MRRSTGTSLSMDICETLKGQITGGLYQPGARVPSTRALAAGLGVSRTTITVAYEKLLAEGYLESRAGSSTFVPPGFQPGASVAAFAAQPASPPRLSAFGQRAMALAAAPAANAPRFDFRYGALSADDFPILAWRRALNAAVLHRKTRMQYGDPAGTPELRAVLQAYLWRARGLHCDPAQIVIVNGSQQALDLCARLLLDPGDRVLVEDPCYSLARDVFTAAGGIPVPVMTDRDGMQTGALPAARLAYVTPSHQFPLGSIMSVSRRQDLLAWARDSNGYVIEDDYDSEFRYDGRPVETMRMLDAGDRVIYVGTLSKTLSPALRLGYIVASPALCAGFAAVKRLADRHTPELLQRAAAALIEDGTYERHIRRLRRRNAARRDALLAAFRTHLGNRITVTGAAAGLHVVAWFNGIAHTAEPALIAAAAAGGVGIYPIGPHCHTRADRPDLASAGAILGYASLTEAQIDRGVRQLAATLATFTPPHSG